MDPLYIWKGSNVSETYFYNGDAWLSIQPPLP